MIDYNLFIISFKQPLCSVCGASTSTTSLLLRFTSHNFYNHRVLPINSRLTYQAKHHSQPELRQSRDCCRKCSWPMSHYCPVDRVEGTPRPFEIPSSVWSCDLWNNLWLNNLTYETTCEITCETTCETTREITCETTCETACETTRETTCETTREITCETT